MRVEPTILFAACLVTALAAQRPQRVPPHFEPAMGTFVARHLDTRAQVVPGGVRLFGPLGHADLRLSGAGDSSLHGSRPTGAVSNYYLGDDWTRHREGVPHFLGVENPQALPGVDLDWLCEGSALRFDLRLARADLLDGVQLGSADWTQLRIDADGCLRALAAGDELLLMAPRAFQGHGRERRELPCRFALADEAVGFSVDGADPELALHIDPVIRWSTALGGSGAESVLAVDVHASGHLAVIGNTSSQDLPLLAGTGLANPTGNSSYVLGFTPAGQLAFSTYLGGTDGGVAPRGGGLDFYGNVLMGGATWSSTLPVASWVLRPQPGNWYFAQLNWGSPWTSGARGALGWCTYGDGGNLSAIHVAERQSVIYAAADWGTLFLPSAYSSAGSYVMSLGGGNQLGVATGVGFSAAITAIHGDGNSNIIVAGDAPPGLPTTPNVYQPQAIGFQSPFVFEFTGSANGYGACTYFGDSSFHITDLDVLELDPMAVAGTVVICGSAGPGLPLVNAARTVPAGAFMARFNYSYTNVDYSTYVGQSLGMSEVQLGSDAQRRSYLSATCTNHYDMPLMHALRGPVASAQISDALLVRLTAAGNQFEYATYLGGLQGAGSGHRMAIGDDGSVAFAQSVVMPYWPQIGPAPMTGAGYDAALMVLSPDVLPAYGTGTPGAESYVPYLSAGGVPTPGNQIRLQVMHGRQGSFGALGLGSAPASAPLFGGTMLINWPLATVPLVLGGPPPFAGVGGTGYATYDLRVPPNPALRGLPVFVQGIFVDSFAPPFGVAMTNGVNVSIR